MATFFWNFRTELEPRWDYLWAVKKGWFPDKEGWKDEKVLANIRNACTVKKEDTNDDVVFDDFIGLLVGSDDKVSNDENGEGNKYEASVGEISVSSNDDSILSYFFVPVTAIFIVMGLFLAVKKWNAEQVYSSIPIDESEDFNSI